MLAHRTLVVVAAFCLLLSGCAQAAAPTPLPTAILLPSATALPPTATPAPPMATPVPPTAMPMAVTSTAAPLTAERGITRGIVGQRLVAVMIDNHPDARPQSGMNAAALVFEALAEGGVTRYMAVYEPKANASISEIGPVRSARSYFVEWAKGLNAVYTHAGGSPEGLLLAETATEIANLDALRDGAEGLYFWRSTTRFAPHNLYTSTELLRKYVIEGIPNTMDTSEQGFLFKLDASPSQRPAEQQLSYFFLYPDQPVGWSYDAQSNGYLRLGVRGPEIDNLTGDQLWFKNIVVMQVDEAPIPNDPKGRLDVQVLGEGTAQVFLDGTMREATWRKDAGYTPLRFYDSTGAEIALNAGPVWIAAVASLSNLTVKGGAGSP